jgi:hypothetical protein
MLNLLEVFDLLQRYVVLIGSWLETFRDTLLKPNQRVEQSKKKWTASPLKMEPIGCPETFVTNDTSALCNIVED